MRITIVGGFFLPLPAVAGGATEKTWSRLAPLFARSGHDVSILSRQWPGLADTEVVEGVRYRRMRGYPHSSWLPLNLLKDFSWSRRVTRALPPADLVVVNTVALPIWLSRLRPDAGKVVIMTGRVPKGQFRHYRGVALAIAASQPILDQVRKESDAIGQAGRVYGYPIDFGQLARDARTATGEVQATRVRPVRVGFVGRIHQEKGISPLVEALMILADRRDLPDWTMTFCGPVEIAQGGSGAAYFAEQITRLRTKLTPPQLELREPEYDSDRLAAVYRSLDVFVLPSLSETGETFGVANIEAMAAGCAVVTSQLECFDDYLEPGKNAISYDHRAPDAPHRLAAALADLITQPDRRHALATAGQHTAQRYDYAHYAERLLRDFERIVAD